MQPTKMEPFSLLCKPFQPCFDVVVNPGHRLCSLPGTVFFRRYVLLYLLHYGNSQDKCEFREQLVLDFQLRFRRAFYFWDNENHLCQFIPIFSINVISKYVLRLFTNLRRSRFYRIHQKQKQKRRLTTGPPPCFSNGLCKPAPKEVFPAISSKFNLQQATGNEADDLPTVTNVTNTASSPDDSVVPVDEDREDAKLLIENAKKMHQLMMEQFSSPDQVKAYSTLFRPGVGKYATQEQNVYAPMIHLCVEVDEDIASCGNQSDDDETYMSKQLQYKYVTSSPKKSMKEKLDELTSQPHETHSTMELYPPRGCGSYRHARPRLPLNIFINYCSKNQDYVLKLVQILRSRNDLNMFHYLFKSSADVRPTRIMMMSESKIEELMKSNCLKIIRMGVDTSQSSLSADFFSYDAQRHRSSLRYHATMMCRKNAIEAFVERTLRPSNKTKHVKFMDCLIQTVKSYTSRCTNRSQRIGWPSWVPCHRNDRWFAWQITALLLLTNSVHDKIVQQIVAEMFSKFPNPLIICGSPGKFIDFLTSKAKNFQPTTANFNVQSDSISKGPNYCFQKAKYITLMSKTVVLRWCLLNGLYQSIDQPSITKLYLEPAHTSLTNPLPPAWIESCLGDTKTLFPPIYDHDFYSTLPGIGLKMRHLCAEGIYNTPVGPAIDCHCIRYGIEFSTIHAAMTLEQMSSCLVKLYPSRLYPALNEMPATISQFMSTQDSLVSTEEFANALLCLSDMHGFSTSMKAFLSHYPLPRQISDSLKS